MTDEAQIISGLVLWAIAGLLVLWAWARDPEEGR